MTPEQRRERAANLMAQSFIVERPVPSAAYSLMRGGANAFFRLIHEKMERAAAEIEAELVEAYNQYHDKNPTETMDEFFPED